MLTVIALNPNHQLTKTHKISIKTLVTRRKFTQKLSKMKTSFNQKPPTVQKKKKLQPDNPNNLTKNTSKRKLRKKNLKFGEM